jgi:hypothetical protein
MASSSHQYYYKNISKLEHDAIAERCGLNTRFPGNQKLCIFVYKICFNAFNIYTPTKTEKLEI